MKSVIEEGSSISKAIQNGWLKAGKPKEFTVKIFQEPKKNFLGFTTVVAKVGIFFNEDNKENRNPHTRPNSSRPYNQNRSQSYHSKNVNTPNQNIQKKENIKTADNQITKPNSDQTQNNNQRPNPHRNRYRPYNKFKKKASDERPNKPK